MRPIFILCEGEHDIAILGPLLEKVGAKAFKAEIKDYPSGLSAFLKGRYGMRNVDGARFGSQSPLVKDAPPTLAASYVLGSSLYLFFVGGGDQQYDAVNSFLMNLLDLASEQTPEDSRIQNFGLLFVRDADRAGVEARLKELKDKHGDALKARYPSLSSYTGKGVIWDGDYSIGACIFARDSDQCGALEHVIEPVLREHYGESWKEAEQLLRTHTTDQSQLGKSLLKWGDSPKRLKALIAICGQPEGPGFSQSVILRDLMRNSNGVVDRLLKEESVKQLQGLLSSVAKVDWREIE